jgi:hypothetical protein
MCKMFWQADLDGERLITDIKHDVIRPIAFDAIMRVRTSTGVRATDFYGHFFMSNTTDMELASTDCDKVRKWSSVTMNVHMNIKGMCTFVLFCEWVIKQWVFTCYHLAVSYASLLGCGVSYILTEDCSRFSEVVSISLCVLKFFKPM